MMKDLYQHLRGLVFLTGFFFSTCVTLDGSCRYMHMEDFLLIYFYKDGFDSYCLFIRAYRKRNNIVWLNF